MKTLTLDVNGRCLGAADEDRTHTAGRVGNAAPA